jgi:hypothetical protein
MNATGISRSGGIVDVGVDLDIIQKSGSFFKYKGETLAQGRDALKLKLEEDPKLAPRLKPLFGTNIKRRQNTGQGGRTRHNHQGWRISIKPKL